MLKDVLEEIILNRDNYENSNIPYMRGKISGYISGKLNIHPIPIVFKKDKNAIGIIVDNSENKIAKIMGLLIENNIFTAIEETPVNDIFIINAYLENPYKST